MKKQKLGNKGTAGMTEASMVIGLLMIAIVMGMIIGVIDGNMAGTTSEPLIQLVGQGNTTLQLIKNICWVVLTLDAIGVLVLVAKWIMSILA